MKKVLILIAILVGVMSCGYAQEAGYKSLNNEEFAKVISKKRVQLVDVRTAKEYQEGHIPRAINIDVKKSDFETQAAKLKKRRPVAVYCKGGKRSKKAAQILVKMGYTVYELDKGISKWKGEVVK